MKAWTRPAAGALILLFLAGCAAPVPVKGWPFHRRADCVPDFPLGQGWLGGDAAYSVLLDGGETLWLFGDSFIGAPGARDRRAAGLVSNSIALSRCTDAGFEIVYYWRQSGAAPAPYFAPPDATTWYWPLAGWVIDRSRVGVFLARIAPDGAPPLGFRIAGSDLAILTRQAADPRAWPVTIERQTDRPGFLAASAAAAEDGTLHLFAVEAADGGAPARLVLGRLSAAPDGLPLGPPVFLHTDGQWRALDSPGAENGLATLFTPAPTELSVRWSPARRQWLALYTDPAFGGDRLMLRTAPRPEGPWSPPTPVHDLAERRGHPADVFCYAGKEQPQFAARDDRWLVATYACHTLDEARLLDDLALYRPRAVRLSLPQAGGQ